MPEERKNRTISISLRQTGTFIADVARTSTVARITAALGASLVTGGSALAFVAMYEPFTTRPVEMLGSYAYIHDLNINNRLEGLALFMLVSVAAFVAFAVFFFAMRERENEALAAIGYSLLPLLFWFTFSLSGYQSIWEPFWLLLSTLLCWLTLVGFLRERSRPDLAGSTALVLIAFGLSFFVTPALSAFVRSPLFWGLFGASRPEQGLANLSAVNLWLRMLTLLPPLWVLLVYLFLRKPIHIVRLALYPAQLALLGFFMLILPGGFLVGRTFTQYFRFAPGLIFIVVPLLLAGGWDCTRRLRSKSGSWLSPFPFLALLFYVYLQDPPVPGYTYGNLFEFGTRMPQFWMSFQGWASLFKDVQMPYGIWDYAQLLLAWLFTGTHTAAVSTYGAHLFCALIVTLEFFAAASLLPVGLAFLLILTAGVGAQSIVLTYCCVLLIPRLTDRPALWIVIWTFLSVLLPFARVPQGTICVAASLPAFVWQAARLFRRDRMAFWRLSGFLVLTALAVTLWPFGQYFWGLVRFFLESSRINAAYTANMWGTGDTPLLSVLLGNSVLIMPIVAVVASRSILSHGRPQSRSFVALFVGTFVLLYALGSLGYGFSRTDGMPYVRQYQTLMTVLLPLIAAVIAYVPSRMPRLACVSALLTFFALGFVNVPAFGAPILFMTPPRLSSPVSYVAAPNPPVLQRSEIRQGAAYDLPELGTGRFPQDYLENARALRHALNRVLAPSETYLDMTLTGLNYFATQRRMVLEQPNYYNHSIDASQVRDLQTLRAHHVVVSLLEPDFYDDTPSPLRAYYLYRYALLNGLPWEITPNETLLMPPAYFARIGLTPPDPVKTLEMLDKQFPATDFGYLPAVWGRGYKDFARDLQPVRGLTAENAPNGAGAGPIRYALQPPLRGADAGLLILAVQMSSSEETRLEVRWVDETLPQEVNRIQFMARNGVLIVPLDASPRWLLARSIVSLTVRASPAADLGLGQLVPSPAPLFQITSASLLQRPYADK